MNPTNRCKMAVSGCCRPAKFASPNPISTKFAALRLPQVVDNKGARFATLTFVAVLSAFACLAQDKPIEPEFNDVFFRLTAGKLVPLERQTAAIHGKASGFIVMSMKASSEFPGAKSPVRFSSGEDLEFVVRTPLAGTGADPAAIYVLRRLESKKKTRELVIMAGHVTPVGGGSKSNLAEGVVPVTFSRYGDLSLKASTARLPPGEYALSHVSGQTIFCFGVD